MTHVDPKVGGWATKEKLTSSQANLIRTAINNSPDFSVGGTYTLTGALTINGTSMLVVGDNVMYTARSVIRNVPLAVTHKTADWSSNNGVQWYTTATNAGQIIEAPLLGLPHGASLSTVTMRYYGGAAARGGLAPATLPRLRVMYSTLSTGATTQLATIDDVFGSEAAYEAAHDITCSAIGHTIDKTANIYFVEFRSESGANAYVGGTAIGLKVTCSVSEQSEWEP